MIALVETAQDATNVLEEPVSASRLNCFHNCRLQFMYRYVQRIKKPVSAALHVGKAVHHALQELNNRRWRGIVSTADDLRLSFDEWWAVNQEAEPVEWENQADQETEQEKAWGLVRHYVENSPIPVDEKPEAVEVSVEADLAKHGLPTLRGVIDLVRPGGEVVDFKTSATTPNEYSIHRTETQLSAYGILFREATGNKESGFALHSLVKTKVPKLVVTTLPAMTEKQQRKLFRSIESYVDGVQREDWVPSPGLQCSACEYFQECRGGGL